MLLVIQNSHTVFFCSRMQQQQLAAQLAHHGGTGRQPPLSPTPSDSDSDISLGAHSPPVSSPGPVHFGSSSPNPITSFRFGAHSPGPMPAQFRYTPQSFGIERQSPTPPNFKFDQKRNPDMPLNVDSASNYDAINLRLTSNDSPIDVDSNTEKNSPIRVDSSPPQTSLHHSPPMNLRISESLRAENMKIETPLPLRLGHQLNPSQITAPLRIQVTSHSRMGAPPPHTNLQGGHSHGGIVRIAPSSSPSNNNTTPVLHRPFSPPRLT